ncbi:prefoldin subunit 1-like [Tropilaelaps mercedesae]|uniref:Prefoldin subunit 1-like n=1 Tax=Tropilaelaps mercedesae TaxID=418985 RepID=A0A1V9X7U6_9ACAR|nr:prefoldin subunit 1-like [Tropilaelaps mercedesae]
MSSGDGTIGIQQTFGRIMAAPAAPDLELKKAFQELQSKMVETQRKLRIADMQVTSHKVSIQKNNIANTVISTYPPETRMYDCIGRMFLLSSQEASKSKLEARNKAAEERIAQLEQNKTYLEKNFKESENNLRELIASKKAST